MSVMLGYLLRLGAWIVFMAGLILWPAGTLAYPAGYAARVRYRFVPLVW